MCADVVSNLARRAQQVNYVPPPFKFNSDLDKHRDVMDLLMDPDKTAFLIIDAQNLFTEPGAPFAGKDGPEIVPYVNKLIKYCRDHDIPVIWVQETHREDGSDLGMMGKYWRSFKPPVSWLKPNGHLWEIYPGLDYKTTDIFIRKPKYNAFWGSDLEVVLRGLGVESLIFSGICTDICVGATMIDAFHRDFNPVLAIEATTTFTPFKQEWLEKTELLWGRVMTTDEVIKELDLLAPKRTK
jgi:ureidoacrylate peracid hydrolase